MLPPGEKTKLRLNYAKAKLWQAKLIQAQLNWSSIMSKLNNEKQNSHNCITVSSITKSTILVGYGVSKTVPKQLREHAGLLWS